MPAKHGTRYSYNQGCRCTECRKAHRLYGVDLRKRRARGEAPPPQPLQRVPASVFAGVEEPEVAVEVAGPGRVECAIRQEIEGLALAAERPGLVEMALELARVLDSRVVGSKPAAAGKLADILERLRKGTDVRKSRLASVRSMTRPGGAGEKTG